MSDIFYEMSGSIRVGNCALVKYKCNRRYLYPEGSVLYSKSKAKIGMLEKVYVKRINFPTRCNYSCSATTPLYVDNFNSIYNERDLTTLQEANNLINQYILLRNELLQQKALDCG